MACASNNTRVTIDLTKEGDDNDNNFCGWWEPPPAAGTTPIWQVEPPPAKRRKHNYSTIPPVEYHAKSSQIKGCRWTTSAMQGHGVDEGEALEIALQRSLQEQEEKPYNFEEDKEMQEALTRSGDGAGYIDNGDRAIVELLNMMRQKSKKEWSRPCKTEAQRKAAEAAHKRYKEASDTLRTMKKRARSFH